MPGGGLRANAPRVEEKEKAEDKEAKSVLSGISSKLKLQDSCSFQLALTFIYRYIYERIVYRSYIVTTRQA